MATPMRAIIGLGNPETKYNNTRHNIGFMVVDKILETKGLSLSEKFKGYFAKKDSLLILLPTTYMNLSGEAVIELVNFYKLKPSDLLVIYDDVSLDTGTLRFRKNGSDGGHNGIKSIIKMLGGNQEFNRLKVGIGPQNKNMDLAAFVLQKFSPAELETIGEISKIACNGALEWANATAPADFEHLQSKYNKKFL